MGKDSLKVTTDYTSQVADHVAGSHTQRGSDELRTQAKIHILDTVIAIVSGSFLQPGRAAIDYAGVRRGAPLSTVAGCPEKRDPQLAALVNGMCAQADETDDTSGASRMHPGASIVSGALAYAEAHGATGPDLVDGVLAGYDLGMAVVRALWAAENSIMYTANSSHGVGQAFGTAVACGKSVGFTREQFQDVLTYAAQLSSGINTVYRGKDHVEKAFCHGGMPALHGVLAADLVRAGLGSSGDVFDGELSIFDAFGEGGSAPYLLDLLDQGSHLLDSDIKQFPAGMPIQAAAQAMTEAFAAHPGEINAESIDLVECRLPKVKAYIVDDREIPDICLQYILAVMIIDGGLTFESAHDQDRMGDPTVRDTRKKIRLISDPSLDPTEDPASTSRRAHLRICLRDGREFVSKVDVLKGTRLDPADWDDMRRKAAMVLGSTVGQDAIDRLVDEGRSLDEMTDVEEFASFWGSLTQQ